MPQTEIWNMAYEHGKGAQDTVLIWNWEYGTTKSTQVWKMGRGKIWNWGHGIRPFEVWTRKFRVSFGGALTVPCDAGFYHNIKSSYLTLAKYCKQDSLFIQLYKLHDKVNASTSYNQDDFKRVVLLIFSRDTQKHIFLQQGLVASRRVLLSPG